MTPNTWIWLTSRGKIFNINTDQLSLYSKLDSSEVRINRDQDMSWQKDDDAVVFQKTSFEVKI